ncbi:MAG: aminopeptidase N [Nitriliruptorales bacterium]|nr:aminopeptidase N [Nitriliruptorales bacterium]
MSRENLTRTQAEQRAEIVRGLHYDVHLDLTGDDQTFESETTIGFEVAQPGSTFVDLTATAVHAATLDGTPLGREAVGGTRLELPHLEPGDHELRVTASMAYQHVGKGLSHFRDPEDDRVYLHSQFQPFEAHLVYACFDQPDLKARFDISVEAPADWVVVSNMPPSQRPDDGGAGRWVFETTPLLPTYLTAVVAGGYVGTHDDHDGLPLSVYVRRSLAEHLDIDEILAVTKQGLDWFQDAFETPYPFVKYDQLFVPEFQAGAMENPGCITFSEAYVFRSKVTDAARERRAETILHEMAHMWFGDLVTMRWWDDLWLNESFADYMAFLAQSEATRWTDAFVTFLDKEKAWGKFQDQLPTTHPVALDMVDIESVHQNFDGITYAKGAAVLKQLVAWVGRDPFLEGCRRYFDTYAFGNADLAEFLGVLESTSGRELSGWADEWLRTTGINTLRLDVEVEDGTYRGAHVRQTADPGHPTLRRHRVAIGLYERKGGTLVRTGRIELDVTGESTEVLELTGRPVVDALVLNDDDLTYAKIELGEETLDLLATHLSDLQEPLPRALVWASAWDMVRDATMPVRRYVDMVSANVVAETEIGVVQRLLARAVGGTERYGDPDHRDTAIAALATRARRQLEHQEPGSDLQLAWARHWLSVARHGDELEDAVRFAGGGLSFEGLELDTDLRWWAVTAVAAHGAAADGLIAEAHEADPNDDLADRNRSSALTARPSADAKAAAWERLMNEDLSLTVSRHLWGPFHQFPHPELSAHYVDPYFEVLPGLFEDRELDWAIEFAEGMFPHPVASDSLLEQTDRFLDRDDLPGPLRRAVLDQRDTLRRTLAARACDRGAAG